MNLQVKIDRIKNNIDAQSYTIAAGEAVKIIEVAYRKLLTDGISVLQEKDRLHVMQAIIETGHGEKGVESFGLGQILGVLRKSKFYDSWEKATQSDLSAIKMVNLDALNSIRIKLTHNACEASKFEAEFLYQVLGGIIQTFGILSLENKGDITQSSTPAPVQESDKEASLLGPVKDDAIRSSTYSPVSFDEFKRLQVQAEKTISVDLEAFKHALSLLPNKDGLIALDVGCAQGHTTRSRFNSFGGFDRVIGIDINKEAIQAASDNTPDGIFEYHILDIESPSTEKSLSDILEKAGHKGFDVIFSALTLLHLKKPIHALRRMRKLLNPGGVIIIRGSDDGSKFAFPDKNHLVEKIIQMYCALPNVEDRLNGRKLYNQLWKSGFRSIKKFHYTKDTAGLQIDDKLLLFQESFSYRADNIIELLEVDPDNDILKEKLNWMQTALEDLELNFESEDFYYMEQDIVAVGQKG